MKEITIKLADNVADIIGTAAKEKGLTSEEFIKYNLGSLAKNLKCEECPGDAHVGRLSLFPSKQTILASLDEFMSTMNDPATIERFYKPALKHQAAEGALSCKNCTMKLTEADVDKGECRSCGVTLVGMFSRDSKSDKEDQHDES